MYDKCHIVPIRRREARYKALWKCPSCGRRFKNTNQSHSCGTYPLDHHLWNKPAHVVALYQLVSESISRVGRVEVVPMKTTILFRGETAFCSVQVGHSYVRLYFQLHRRIEELAGLRVTEVSAGRFVHEVKLTQVDQFDDRLEGLLVEAAELAGVGSN